MIERYFEEVWNRGRLDVLDELVEGEDAIAVRVTMRGTHRGDFFGIPPTGKAFVVTQMNLERFRDGRIVEHWRNTDELGLLRQLGLVR